MIKFLLAAGLLVTMAACGPYRFPGDSSGNSGTVSGHMLAVPCAPVEPADQACAGRAMAGVELSFSNGSQTIAAVTDSNGHYSIDLAAGVWKVAFKSPMRIISGPPAVNVVAGSSIMADYIVDSGIRVPIPQQ